MFEPKGIALAVALVVAFGVAIKWGEHIGATDIRKEVAENELARSKVITKLQDDLAEAVANHSKEMTEIQDEYNQAQLRHSLAVDALQRDADKRLQLSETRANVYKRQSHGSSVEQERLAKHAAELDRTLEEGRHLVAELREAIRQRDDAIRALGSMILTDRKLFSPE